MKIDHLLDWDSQYFSREEELFTVRVRALHYFTS